jgi:phage tail P2-like protein
MSDLLPHNATTQERALEDTAARISDVDVIVREIWNPDTCPESVLPWLAWSFSVDTWQSDWTDDQKRAAIKSTIDVQQTKGTVGAVRQSISSASIAARVIEWHRDDVISDPYTYRIEIETEEGAVVPSLSDIEQILAAVNRTKSLRSHLDKIEVSTSSLAGPYVAAVSAMGNEIVVGYGGQLL